MIGVAVLLLPGWETLDRPKPWVLIGVSLTTPVVLGTGIISLLHVLTGGGSDRGQQAAQMTLSIGGATAVAVVVGELVGRAPGRQRRAYRAGRPPDG